jgi:hypothetical protein
MKNLKTKISIIFLAVITNLTFAQTTQEREVTDFTGIDASEGITVELTTGKETNVVVEADESIIDEVVTEVKANTLTIYMKGNTKIKSNIITVRVTAQSINNLDVSSGASIITQNLIEAEKLTLSSSSGAHLKVAFKAPSSSCKTSSGASAKLKGVSKYFKGNASSGSHINAEDLKSINATVDVSSGANITINVEERLEAEASSGGSINYSGNPKNVDISKSSGGSVHKN